MDAVSYSKASAAYKLASQNVVALTTKADLTTSGVIIPVGTTAARPTLGAGEAALRYNTDTGGLEDWNGTVWKNVTADITAVVLKGTDTAANILLKTGMIAEDLWIASDTLDAYVYDGTTWINVGPLQGPQGVQGIQGAIGNGVASVTKTTTVGLVDTYTVMFTDTTTTTFDVTNGLEGQKVDHVSKTGGTGLAGTTDTYTVWGDLAETINLGTFLVYNGQDGGDSINDDIVTGTTLWSSKKIDNEILAMSIALG